MADETKDSVEVVTAVAVEWAKLSYDDMLQPYATALGDVGRIVTFPIAWLRHKMQPLLESVRRKVPKEKVVEPPKVVAAPILQALPAAEDEPDLRAMYEELLAKSMHADNRDDVHPAYAGVVGQLSPDEARLLHGFRAGHILRDLPLLGLSAHAKDEHFSHVELLTGPLRILGEFRCCLTLQHPNLVRASEVDLYLRNFERLGLVRQQFERSANPLAVYEDLDRFASGWLRAHDGLHIHRMIGTVKISSFGRGFMNAALPATAGALQLGPTYVLERKDSAKGT